MPRMMSFSHTTEQVKNQTKTVTRRYGWGRLRPGDLLQPVIKARGLPKGTRPEKIGPPIRVLSLRYERLDEITNRDVALEGFPAWSKDEFVSFFCKTFRVRPHDIITRIEFEYTNAARATQLEQERE